MQPVALLLHAELRLDNPLWTNVIREAVQSLPVETREVSDFSTATGQIASTNPTVVFVDLESFENDDDKVHKLLDELKKKGSSDKRVPRIEKQRTCRSPGKL